MIIGMLNQFIMPTGTASNATNVTTTTTSNESFLSSISGFCALYFIVGCLMLVAGYIQVNGIVVK
jgi:hypothetical protein